MQAVMAFFLPLCQKAGHCLDKGDKQRKTGYPAFFLIYIPADAVPAALISMVSERGSRGITGRGERSGSPPLPARPPRLVSGWGVSTGALIHSSGKAGGKEAVLLLVRPRPCILM